MTNAVLKRVREYIGSRNIFPDAGCCERPVVVALSGGADSVALLDVMLRLGYKCVAAHCNFHLRGDESNRDEAHSRSVAQRLGAEFVVQHFDIEHEKSLLGGSTEMVCRDVRYRWFAEVVENYNAVAVAVAHHSDDNVETFFLNALRGTGVKGLAGMAAASGSVIRPLLCLSRKDIEDYLAERGLDYVVDHTNLENDFKRNRLRNVVIPTMRTQFPGCDTQLTRTVENVRRAADFLADVIAEKGATYIADDGSIDLGKLVDGEGRWATFVLYNLLSTSGASYNIVEDIMADVNRSGRVFNVDGNKYLLNRGILAPLHKASPTEVIFKDFAESPFNVEIVEGNEVDRSRLGKDSVAFDASILDGDPVFTLRPWRRGDRLKPFGMKGSRLVSDILNDAKVALDRKGEVMILERDGEVLWVVGYRASRHFSVTPATRRYLLLTTR